MNQEALDEAGKEEMRHDLANEAAIALIGNLQRRGADATEIAATFTHMAAAVCVGLAKAIPFPPDILVDLCTIKVRTAMISRLCEHDEAAKIP